MAKKKQAPKPEPTADQPPDPVTSDEIDSRRDMFQLVLRDLIDAYYRERLEQGMSRDEAEKWSMVDAIGDSYSDAAHMIGHAFGFGDGKLRQLLHTMFSKAVNCAEECVKSSNETVEPVVDEKQLS